MKVCGDRVARPLSDGLLRRMPANRPLRSCTACASVTRGVRHGLCVPCYTRKYRRGTVDRVPSRTPEERFDAKVNKTESCWLWTGGLAQDGYGAFHYNGKTGLAHRYSHQRFIGPIPDGHIVCHKCDVRLCVRPDHLFAGVPADNVSDCVSKGRNARGVTVSRAKITEDDVRSIRSRAAAGEGPATIARSLGMTTTNIRFIVTRRTWKHVE